MERWSLYWDGALTSGVVISSHIMDFVKYRVVFLILEKPSTYLCTANKRSMKGQICPDLPNPQYDAKLYIYIYINGLVQDCSNIANVLELL